MSLMTNKLMAAPIFFTGLTAIKIFFRNNVGCTLQEIIESCSKFNACLQYESLEDSESAPCDIRLKLSV